MENVMSQCFYSPGDIVTIRHNIPNKPVMWIVEKMSRNVRKTDGTYETVFQGMKCKWFDKNEDLQEGCFNTKDLELVK